MLSRSRWRRTTGIRGVLAGLPTSHKKLTKQQRTKKHQERKKPKNKTASCNGLAVRICCASNILKGIATSSAHLQGI